MQLMLLRLLVFIIGGVGCPHISGCISASVSSTTEEGRGVSPHLKFAAAAIYAQTQHIAAGTKAIKHHFNITSNVNVPAKALLQLQPRHVWSKTYTIMLKINLWRHRHGLAYMEPAYLEPSLEVALFYIWEATQRILTEIDILKNYLGIKTTTKLGAWGVPTSPITKASRTAVDAPDIMAVFNNLNQISHDWDLLLGESIHPNQVYSEAMRINEDVNILLRHWDVLDDAILPNKIANSTPTDSLYVALAILHEVQEIQRHMNITVVDLSPLRKTTDVMPEDVFDVLGLVLTELQTIKARQGLLHHVTTGAVHVEGKTPTEVRQLLSYVLLKIKLLPQRNH